MTEQAQKLLSNNLTALSQLVEQYPLYIPVVEAATLLHTTPASLRASMEQGRCPFGFSWQLGDRAGFKIPTITFVNWLTKGLGISI